MTGSNFANLINPFELDLIIQTIQPTELQDLGSQRWLAFHANFHRIHQQTILEASVLKEETVKDKLILHEKVPLIVHEVICTSIWRKYVFLELLAMHPDPKNTFIPFSILFHEATAVALLETLLYHEESCESLGDSAIDLIDYCVGAVTFCISRKDIIGDTNDTINMTSGHYLKREEQRLKFDIGIRSITILRCLAEYLDSLMPTVARRMYELHDLPILFVELINNPPWLAKDSSNEDKIYTDGKWQDIRRNGAHENQLSKMEGQTWIGLLFLLMSDHCQTHYQITEARKNRLLQLQRHLNENVLDQLAPLMDLKQWLSHLSVSSPPVNAKPLVVEVVPEIRERILKSYSMKWKKLIAMQSKTLFNPVGVDMQDIANSLSGAYDLSKLASLLQMDNYCSNGCASKATRRCSRCKTEWYCGRECQVKHWPKHKVSCNLHSNSN
ncbi:zinc finger MYND domain-containing protein 10 [Hetaerina americana]|uniref:zinc finger MYND domain-containing protein 10 n=1 Tax=Hetaerina americana TaxID=62018 RepID=UPI003A7F4FBF